MKLIKELTDMIEEELEGAENYAKLALYYKADNKPLADVMHEIANQEMRHVSMLHDEVVKVIKNHRETHGEPPAAMLAIYDWQHKKQIDFTNKVKLMLESYKTG